MVKSTEVVIFYTWLKNKDKRKKENEQEGKVSSLVPIKIS